MNLSTVLYRVWGVLLLTAMPMAASNVVTDWTGFASTAIVKTGGKGPGASGVWFAYSSLAVYDAVNTITGKYRPFYYHGAAPPNASIQSAVAAAAHRVLVNYFPSQQSTLDDQYMTSLSGIGDADADKAAGIAVGEAAAAALIAARKGDGLEANVPYVPGSGPGVWIPTPPAFAAAATPWLGQMRPFTMVTSADFRPDGPTPLNSEPWKRDYNLTRQLGGVNSVMRTPAESEIGIFWTENTGQQYARAFGYLVDTYHLSVPDTARMMAMFWTGFADAVIGCYEAKYAYSFWRPVTAINQGGGSADLPAEPAWLPLGTTPNHPEYPAAHACITGAVTTTMASYFGTTKTHVVVDSLAFTDGVHTHTFEDTRNIMDEVFWARIYAGFHFYHSLEDGRQLGMTVAHEMLQSHFGLQHAATPNARGEGGDK